MCHSIPLNEQGWIGSLPEELLLMILSHTGYGEWSELAQTCKGFLNFIGRICNNPHWIRGRVPSWQPKITVGPYARSPYHICLKLYNAAVSRVHVWLRFSIDKTNKYQQILTFNKPCGPIRHLFMNHTYRCPALVYESHSTFKNRTGKAMIFRYNNTTFIKFTLPVEFVNNNNNYFNSSVTIPKIVLKNHNFKDGKFIYSHDIEYSASSITFKKIIKKDNKYIIIIHTPQFPRRIQNHLFNIDICRIYIVPDIFWSCMRLKKLTQSDVSARFLIDYKYHGRKGTVLKCKRL